MIDLHISSLLSFCLSVIRVITAFVMNMCVMLLSVLNNLVQRCSYFLVGAL